MSEAWYPLLRRLAAAGGQWRSGQALAEELGLSRAAVWKQIQALQALGLAVESQSGRGYRLPGAVSVLEPERIARRAGIAANRLQILPRVDSTSAELRRQFDAGGMPAGTVIAAETQSAGRGRQGRPWHSPLAANLYFSMHWRADLPVSRLGGLSLAVGVAVCRALDEPRLRIKWPNDLVVDHRKLGGVLVELAGEAGGPVDAFIGIGINVCMPESAKLQIDQPWIDLTRLGDSNPDRSELLGRMIAELAGALDTFEAQGLAPFGDEYRRLDALAGQTIRVVGGPVSGGVAQGVDEFGRLRLKTPGGPVMLSSGEVSVRRDATAA